MSFNGRGRGRKVHLLSPPSEDCRFCHCSQRDKRFLAKGKARSDTLTPAKGIDVRLGPGASLRAFFSAPHQQRSFSLNWGGSSDARFGGRCGGSEAPSMRALQVARCILLLLMFQGFGLNNLQVMPRDTELCPFCSGQAVRFDRMSLHQSLSMR